MGGTLEEPTLSFSEIATAYAQDVVAGKIPANKYHRLACARHLNDLAKVEAGASAYVFNPELVDKLGKKYFPAERICRFAQMMPHIKGDWAGRRERIKLERWQVFVLVSIFAWIVKATGKRRFAVADLYVPRKNAKSTLAAIIGLYMLTLDGEFGAEIYSGATSQDQAMEVFRPALLMARASPEFCKRYGVTPNASNISVGATNSKFEPIIGKPGDGASPSCAIIDEFHEHKTAQLFDAMQTGMMARSQAFMLVITTAGADIAGPCYQHQVEGQKILEGVIEDDRRFVIIFGIDEGADWTSIEALVKANPNYGVSVMPDVLIALQQEAIHNPRKQSVFKTKHLNVWVQSASPWLNLYNLQRGGDPTLTLEQFKREHCIAGLDLASKQDIASRLFLFEREFDGQTHYYALTRNYVPEDAVKKPENAHYQGWVIAGHLIQTPGNMIALRQIEEELVADSEKVVVEEVAIDAWGAREMAPSLQEQGFEVIDIPMNVKFLSEPMKKIAALNDAGLLHHDGNPAFVWMLGNVEVKEDRNANIFPRKAADRPENKIDAAVALIVAMHRAMGRRKKTSIYNTRGIMVIE